MNNFNSSDLQYVLVIDNKLIFQYLFGVRIVMFNATFNKISVISGQSVLLVEETKVPGENHRPVASHWQTWSHNVVSSTPCHELTILVVIGTDCTGSCKSNYHTITITKPPVNACIKCVNYNILWNTSWRIQ